jgi:hypothetical protein
LNVPRWRRSKFSTAGSCVTPESACEITAGEIPAACASTDHRRHEGVEIAAAAGGERGCGDDDRDERNGRKKLAHANPLLLPVAIMAWEYGARQMHWNAFPILVMAGHSRPKDGVASARL